MKLAVNSFALLFTLMAACTATPPPTASLKTGAPAPIPIQTQASVAADTPAPSVTQAEATGTAPAMRDDDYKTLEKQARSLGYKPQVHEGKQYFCRVATPTGSHIPVNDCVSPEGLQYQLAAQNGERSKLPISTGCMSSSNVCRGK